jgi:small neutral amino acid transporter SnatA (MarC family)
MFTEKNTRPERTKVAALSAFTAFAILLFFGVGGTRIVTRLMGLLLAVIAVQFMVNGFQQI